MKPLLFTAFLMAFGCSCAQPQPFVISPPAKDYAGQIVKPPKTFSDSLAIIPPLMPPAAKPPSSLFYGNGRSLYNLRLNPLTLNAPRLVPGDLLRLNPMLYLNLRPSRPLVPNLHESWLKERRNKIERTRISFLRHSPKGSLLSARLSPLPNLTAFQERRSLLGLRPESATMRALQFLIP